MKKILIFSLAYLPQVGGAEIALKEITTHLEEYEFHMVTLRFGSEPEEEKIGNITVHRLGRGSTYSQKILFIPRAAKAAARLHATHHFDAWWAMMSYMLFPIVLLRMRGVRVPYVLSLQEGDPFSHMFRRWFILPFIPLLRSGFRHADRVQAISTYLATWARRMGFRGVPEVIPNGVNVTLFSNPVDTQAKQLLRTRALPAHGGTLLVTTSRLVYKNGVDTVIRALPLLPDNVRFMIVGSGPLEQELKNLAHKLRVHDRVLFVEYREHTSLPLYLQSADIFIRPSRSEGLGISFIEAMAAGVPVIGTQVGGIADFLFDSLRNPGHVPTGWVVDPDSPEQIAKAVKTIQHSITDREHIVHNAYQLVSEKYTWAVVAQGMRVVFETALKTSTLGL